MHAIIIYYSRGIIAVMIDIYNIGIELFIGNSEETADLYEELVQQSNNWCLGIAWFYDVFFTI